MEAYLLDWANLLLRWLHVIAGIAWIGASFYFVMLDLSLRKPTRSGDEKRGVFGELWAVHGGGVYHSEKFLAGPLDQPLPEHLHWSKWEAYTTWLSGMGLLAIVYWVGANTYLIDAGVMALTLTQAVAISVASIVISWFIYDVLCRLLVDRENLLALALFIYIVLLDWLLFHIFSARAAYLHVGAIMGSIMVGNVFFHIIPGQKKMLAEIRAGQTPDPIYGIVGKQRSVHNTYFTLPVLFAMISNHYPMTYSHPQGWLVLIGIMLAGVLIRQFFVLRHTGRQLWWLVGLALALMLTLMVWLRPVSPQASVQSSGQSIDIGQVMSIIEQRCVPCHASTPTRPGFAQPPKGIVLETADQLRRQASLVAQTVSNRYMPLGNLTAMTEQERMIIAAWYATQSAGENRP